MNYIILDTNTLFKRSDDFENYAVFKLNRKYYSIKSLLKDNNIDDKFKILLPKMVLLELEQQQKEYYEKEKEEIEKKLSKFKELGDISFNINFEIYNDFLKNKIEAYIKEEGIELIEICNNNWFNEIIDKSILKKPPFEGSNGKSDKGFKDVVIWQSIIQFAQTHDGIYLLLTNDNIFVNNNKTLMDEFKKNTSQSVILVKDMEQFNIEISKIQNLTWIQDDLFRYRKRIRDSKKIEKMIDQLEMVYDVIVNGESWPLRYISYIPGNFTIESFDTNGCLITFEAKVHSYYEIEIIDIQFRIKFENKDDKLIISNVESVPLNNNVDTIDFDVT